MLNFFPTVPPGYKIILVPSIVIYLIMRVKTIDYLKLRIVNWESKSVNFRGEMIIIRLHIKSPWWAFLIWEDLSAGRRKSIKAHHNCTSHSNFSNSQKVKTITSQNVSLIKNIGLKVKSLAILAWSEYQSVRVSSQALLSTRKNIKNDKTRKRLVVINHDTVSRGSPAFFCTLTLVVYYECSLMKMKKIYLRVRFHNEWLRRFKIAAYDISKMIYGMEIRNKVLKPKKYWFVIISTTQTFSSL